jgi:Protein of unknown function (DUF2878)
LATFINIAMMQIGWFACVLGAANQIPWLGPIVAVPLVVWHIARSSQRNAELRLVLCALWCGLILDSVLASANLIQFASGITFTGFTTPWMLSLWMGFAITLNHSLKWLMAKPMLALLFGLLGGPVAYWSGTRLGAMTFGTLWPSLIAIGIGWTLAMGSFVLVSRRNLDDHRPVLA